MPRSSAGAPGIPYVRFPRWLFCPSLPADGVVDVERRSDRSGSDLFELRNHPQLVPMRFVVVCEHGHLADLPWEYWAHFGASKPSQRMCKSKNLLFTAVGGEGGGLESLAVKCAGCDAERSLRGIASHGSLKPLNLRCLGLQPWQAGTGEDCAEEPQVVQRGATNVYFGHTPIGHRYPGRRRTTPRTVT